MSSFPSQPQTDAAADRLSGEFGAAFAFVLDMIVPPRASRGLPGAAEVGVLDYLRIYAAQTIGEIVADFERLDFESENRHGLHFSALDDDRKRRLVDSLRAGEPAFMQRLALEAVSAYYIDPRVLAGLEIEDRPPYPKGYQVIAGDLTLLEPVRRRGRIFREAWCQLSVVLTSRKPERRDPNEPFVRIPGNLDLRPQ